MSACLPLAGRRHHNGMVVYVHVFLFPEVDTFVGLVVTPGQALIDTGAQHGVVGPDAYRVIVGKLSEYGLKPRSVPNPGIRATGIGGASDFQGSYEIPAGLGGCSGLLTVHVLDDSCPDVPLLLPVDFCERLGMVLDLNTKKAFWKTINKHSTVARLPTGHLAIDLFEFPANGWENPHESSS